jgi:hypothetical protein
MLHTLSLRRCLTSNPYINVLEVILKREILFLLSITAGVLRFTLDHFDPCTGAISEAALIHDQIRSDVQPKMIPLH